MRELQRGACLLKTAVLPLQFRISTLMMQHFIALSSYRISLSTLIRRRRAVDCAKSKPIQALIRIKNKALVTIQDWPVSPESNKN